MRDWRWNFLFHYLLTILQRSVFDFCIEPVELRNQTLLAQGELLIIYPTLSVASALSGESVGQQLVPLISTPFWLATPENKWASLFHRHLPR